MTEKKDKKPKKEYPRLVTKHAVTLVWPKLLEPDYGSKKFPKPDGEYQTQVVLNEDSVEAKSLIAQIEPFMEQARKEAEEKLAAMKVKARKELEAKGGLKANPLFSVKYDEETEEPTGEIEFKFARAAAGTYKNGPKKGKRWEAKVGIFDAKGKACAPSAIWGGTVAKISFEPSPYFIEGTGAYGVKLRLVGVQVLKLVAYGGQAQNAKDCGFGEEDGYEASDDSGGFDDETGSEGSDDAATDAAASDDRDF